MFASAFCFAGIVPSSSYPRKYRRKGSTFSRKISPFLSILLLNQSVHQSQHIVSFESAQQHGLEGKQLLAAISYFINLCQSHVFG
jgi:hypothetical protein